ncbi:MAG: dihydrolipoamide acetyltransferase family protein [Thiomonas sp.]|jgi:pyruvate dehydrogenase E2 component (dihydrolipoamide acetyltransferase)
MTQTAVTLPVLSDTMQTGRIVRWLKQPGDAVKTGDVLAEVESDKAIMDVEAYADGVLVGPLAPVDTDIAVKSTIAWIADQPASAAALVPQSPPAAASPSAADAAPPQTATGLTATLPTPAPLHRAAAVSPVVDAALAARGADDVVSPVARGLAAELGIDVQQLAPGSDGRISAAQVLAAAIGPLLPRLQLGAVQRIDRPSSLKAAMAAAMQRTVHTPVFHLTVAIDLQPLHAAAAQQQQSVSLLLARGCALAIDQHPDFNSCWTPGGLARRDTIDVAIAVDTPDGLLTPVLRDALRPLADLAADWRALREKIARRRLLPTDYSGATFYLSNLGMFAGVEQFDAIVPLGAAAILAVSAPGADGLTRLTLSCDHRVVAGADAARFLATLRERLQAVGTLVA